MATILFTYEFGAGLGHLNRLVRLARELRDHKLVFALPDVPLGRGLIERTFGTEATIRQGLVWPEPADPQARKVPTLTFADVIRLFDFHDLERLVDATRRGLALLDSVRPDLIVADFAPTLRLASQGAVPTLVAGNGYTVPPPARPLPPIRPWESSVPALSRAHEGELLASINRVRAQLHGPAVDFVADLFQGEQTFVCTLAEFDPYGRWRSSAPIWPFNVPTISSGNPERERDRIFAYFQAGHPALHAVLQALSQIGLQAEVYVEGVDPRVVASRCGRNVGIHTSPADFAAVLPRSRLLVHHAGLGTAYAGLVGGVPQAVLPLNLEHAITSIGLEAFGSTVRLPVAPPPERDTLAQSFASLLEANVHRQAAGKAAAELARRRDPRSAERIVQAARAFL